MRFARPLLLSGALLLAACAGPDYAAAPKPLPSGKRIATLGVLPLAGEAVTLTKLGVVSFSNEEELRVVPDWGLEEAFRRAVETALAGGPVKPAALRLTAPDGRRPRGLDSAKALLQADPAARPLDAVLVVEEDAAGMPDDDLPSPDLHGCGLFYRVGLLASAATPFCRYRLVVLDGQTLEPVAWTLVRDSAVRQELRPVDAADRGYGSNFAAATSEERAALLRQDLEAIIARSVPLGLAELGLTPPK